MRLAFVPLIVPCLLALPLRLEGAAILDLVPGSNLLPIDRVTYQIGLSEVIQNNEAVDVSEAGDTSVNVKSVRITDGAPVNLTFFNTQAAKVVNVNPQFSGIGGVGVFDNGVTTNSQSNLTAYADAYAATVLDSDLRNFTFNDYLTPGPATPGTPDLDVLFYHALEASDYFLIAERWGNSQFTVTALDAQGNPYEFANVLRLGGPGGAFGVGYEVYQWNTGYAAGSNVASQAQALSVFKVSKFFENTQGLAGPVYGLRIDNDGEADPKIMGISNDTFLNNPENPQLVPEPSAFLITLMGSLLWVGSRKRRS